MCFLNTHKSQKKPAVQNSRTASSLPVAMRSLSGETPRFGFVLAEHLHAIFDIHDANDAQTFFDVQDLTSGSLEREARASLDFLC